MRLTMEKPRPGGDGTRLLVSGWYAAHRSGEPSRGPARYHLLTPEGDTLALGGVQWADWADDARLLVATEAGALEVRPEPTSPAASWSVDLAPLTPDPTRPPPEAAAW